MPFIAVITVAIDMFYHELVTENIRAFQMRYAMKVFLC